MNVPLFIQSFHRGYYPAYPLLAGGGFLLVALALLLPILPLGVAVGSAVVVVVWMGVIVWSSVLPRWRKRREYAEAVRASWRTGSQPLEEASALHVLADRLGLHASEALGLQERVIRRLFGPPEKRGVPRGRPIPSPGSPAALLAAEFFEWDPTARVLTLIAKPTGPVTGEMRLQVVDLVRWWTAHARGYVFAVDGAHNPRLYEDVESNALWTDVMLRVRLPRSLVCYNVAPESQKMLWLFGRLLRRKPFRFEKRPDAIAWGQASHLARAELRMRLKFKDWLEGLEHHAEGRAGP